MGKELFTAFWRSGMLPLKCISDEGSPEHFDSRLEGLYIVEVGQVPCGSVKSVSNPSENARQR
jgi:hypothetical protein